MKGVDYSWARPGGKAIREAGYQFVIRYIDYPGAAGKGLTRAELDDLRANDISVALVFEQVPERPLQGRRAGMDDAATSVKAIEALGMPTPQPVYFAVDFDAQSPQFSAIDDYFRGVSEVIGRSRTGVYGSYDVLAHCKAMGLVTYYWQALAWSRGRSFEGRHLYQYGQGTVNGGEVDFNEAYVANFGQWPAEEIDMKELEDLILACFSGGEEGNLTRAERLTNAKYRMGLVVNGTVKGEQPASRSLAQRIASSGGVAPGTKFTITGEGTTK